MIYNNKNNNRKKQIISFEEYKKKLYLIEDSLNSFLSDINNTDNLSMLDVKKISEWFNKIKDEIENKKIYNKNIYQLYATVHNKLKELQIL